MRNALLGLAWFALMAAACADGDEGDEVIIVESVGFFEPCVFDEDCPQPANCHVITIDYGDVIVEDAMCTVACGSDLDCPTGGVCRTAASGPPLCYRACFDDLDCPIGFACIQEVLDYAFEPTCVPF
jgi:hypothetical protein